MVDEEAVEELKEIIERAQSGDLPEGFLFLIDNDKVRAGHWGGAEDESGDEKFVEIFSCDYGPGCLLEDLLAALGIDAQGV
ncbi:hypothetical protein LCGC14_0317800 [marine sediment metagenome]|uniref:Uncharacterized protein n=1 Tax=marine sediment metagenome TaxID=412755 RepID=A0A0F9W773_9ZZZZ